MCKRENRSNNSSSNTTTTTTTTTTASSSGGDDSGGGRGATNITTTATNTTTTVNNATNTTSNTSLVISPNTSTSSNTTTSNTPDTCNTSMITPVNTTASLNTSSSSSVNTTTDMTTSTCNSLLNTSNTTSNTTSNSPPCSITTNTTSDTLNTTTASNTNTTPLLVSFGNPLLDITAVVRDDSLHRCFGLPVDGQLEVTEEQRPVFSHVMKEYPVEYTAGGCALNSSRVFCWVLGEGQRVVFVGGIGKDEAARRLSAIVEASGVITRFVVVEGQPTGACVALVLGACRCLCADIGAAATCLPQHVFTPDLLPVMEAAEFIYVEGYFITHSFPAALQIAEYAQQKEKTLVFNLCGSYVCENNSEELRQLLPFVDILFGFVEEYRTLDRSLDVEELSATQCHDSENLCHDLLLVLRVIRGEEEVIEDCVKEKTEHNINSSSSSSSSSVLASTDSSSTKMNSTTASPQHHNNTVNSALCDGEENGSLVDGVDGFDDHSVSESANTASHSDKNSTSQSPRNSTTHSRNSPNQSPMHSTNQTKHLTNGTVHLANGNHHRHHSTTTLRDHRVKQRVVVVTKGPSPLLYAQKGVVRQRPVPPITPEEIVDTTGAGDSFVGGFLAALSRGRSLQTCLDCGVWTAQHLLKQKGCTLPPYPADFLA